MSKEKDDIKKTSRPDARKGKSIRDYGRPDRRETRWHDEKNKYPSSVTFRFLLILENFYILLKAIYSKNFKMQDLDINKILSISYVA